MREETSNTQKRRSIRLDATKGTKCDACLETHDCCTIRFVLKDVNLCGECYDCLLGSIIVANENAATRMAMKSEGFTQAHVDYQPEPDLHEIEMVESELWIKDKE